MTDFVPQSIFGNLPTRNQSMQASSSAAALASEKEENAPLTNAEGSKDASDTTEIKTHNQYKTSGLDESNLCSSALVQFNKWFKEAIEHSQIPEPESMTLSTVAQNQDGIPIPSSRVVLLKKVDARGFLFYSNYNSRKGREISRNPNVALTFYWYPLHRSVRVCGKIERLSNEENDRYFNSRPVGSRIGAISSPQSQIIRSRKELEDIVRSNESKYDAIGSAGLDGEEPKELQDKKIPVPDYWGGFRVVPHEVEFWMGRSNRLHDRFRYTRSMSSEIDKWTIDRLAP